MAAPASAEEFMELVRKSGVVDEKRLDTYVQGLRSGGAFPDEPGKMAGLMVRDGLLTHFQAEQFLLGKWRRFTIGKYKVLERLGSGGMGSVYLCEHKFMRRRVAVKVLPAAKAEDPASLERFYREARAAAALDHPNIVRAYDIDQDENLHFLVMEYVDGASLQEIIKKSGPMNMLRAAHYVRQAAVGMQHAHEAGLVHRDIKPGNLLVDRAGTLKVLDMGLARFFHDEEDILTKKYDESVLGTADYLAPEQALDSHGVDIRADIYSLGATFYFCLTGSPPFNEGTVAQKLIWHQTRQPKPIRSIRPEVPEALAAIIDRMMTKDRLKRFQTPAQVAEALAPLTTRPIPPPPEAEMPRLSPAAMGVVGGESTMVNSPPPASPVPQRTAPAAAQAPRPVAAPHVAALHTPPPRPPAQPAADPRRVATPPPRPQPRPAVAPGNGAFTPTTASVRTDEQTPNWGELVTSVPSHASRPQASSRASMPRVASKARVKGMIEAVKKRPLFSLVVGVIGLLILVAMIVVLSMALGGKRGSKANLDMGRRLAVSQLPAKGEFRSVKDALLKALPGDHVVVADDPHEELLDLKELARTIKDVTIEADPTLGKRVVWRPPPPGKPGTQAKQLLALSDCPGLTLKGFHLTGQNSSTQVLEYVVTVFGRCPGLKVEDVGIEGFSHSGIKLINCSGESARPIVLTGVRTVSTPKETSAAIIVEVSKSFVNLSTMEHVRIENSRFEGPYKAGVLILLEPTCSINQVELARNRFFCPAAQGDALLYKKQTARPVPGMRLTLDSNTFCNFRNGLHLESLPLPEASRIVLKNNLFVRTDSLAWLDHDAQLAPTRGPATSPAQWIWFDEGDPSKDAPPGNVYFRKAFTLPKGVTIASAQLDAVGDDAFTVWLNGNTWKSPRGELGSQRIYCYDVTPFLQTSADAVNCIAVQGTNVKGPAGLMIQLSCTYAGNPARHNLVLTDGSWKALRGEPPPTDWHLPQFKENEQWRPAKPICQYGMGMPRNLFWDSAIRGQLAGVTEKVCPSDTGTVRDAASNEGMIALRSRIVDCGSLGVDPNNAALFLRYPAESPLSRAGTNGGPVGAPPIN
jgi:eukaryotic-like serine/threonine-protein kinase